jgi:ATP-binding cassette, subfamily C, bacterial CydD
MPAMALAAALPIIFAALAFSEDSVVGILFLVSAPLIPVFMALVGWGAEAASAQHQQAFLRLSGFFADRLRGLVTLKLLGRGAAEARRLREAGEDLRSRTLAVLRIAFLSSAVLEFFAALGVAGVALYVGLTYLGFLHLRSTPLTLETGLFCLVLAPEVYFPLRQFAAHYHDRAAAKAAIAALGSMFEGLPALVETERTPVEHVSLLRSQAATVVVSSLSVRAPDGRLPVLTEIEATIKAGSRVAIIGASGSGKSTFLETIARLRSAQGSIEIDGLPISDIPEREFRTRVAVLGQRPRLFQGSIADNIRFGCPEAKDDQIREAAERAGVLRFTTTLRDALATQVGEAGLGLSGGEARRVALARVFLRRPDLILLDEPTAHLDRVTEDAVLDGILEFANGRTLIIATHSETVMRQMVAVLRIEDHRLLPTRCGRHCTAAAPSAGLKSASRRDLRLS